MSALPLVRLGLGAIAASTLAVSFVLPAPATAASAGLMPDPWLYCAHTVPKSTPARVSYAGIYANPHYNSARTSCRDLFVTGRPSIAWYKARPVDWTTTCRWTYGNNRVTAYVSGGRVYCYWP
ncbi:hypothetical protein VSS74_16315 [Conexibacter stalactiti]|uniref:Uncharacterized protein n=1 Tax=Conexibacter stalactiti TaxID=1940611 RepID=A0ABU4HRU1_9ACTN|nr:hypothetical protein [Conexibacter stalactiti]MDW5595914.1 hypothetical protein [Conexibacter stalactiti]MEC5036556.1 hypothetical protein [Conexibacter stalactiti]